jgi:hypothetical protein
MKNTLRTAGIIATVFLLGSPVITEASQRHYTTGYVLADQKTEFSTGKHIRKKTHGKLHPYQN